MANIKKTISTKVNENGFAQILLRIREGRQGINVRIKTGVFVPIVNWNEKKESVVIPKKIGLTEKKELQDIKDKLELVELRSVKIVEIFGENATKEIVEHTLDLLKDYDGTVTPEIIKKYQVHQEESNALEKGNIFKLASDYLRHNSFSVGRNNFYKVLFRIMARYQIFCEVIKKNGFCWNINTTSKNDILKFFDYLTTEHDYRKKFPNVFADVEINKLYPEGENKTHRNARIEKRGDNRIIDLKKAIKAFWNWLLKNEITTNNPFASITIGSQTFGTPFFLTVEERNIIASYDFSSNPAIEIQRDIFIFQCMVACRVGDLMAFTLNNIVDDVLVYTPHKTKDEQRAFTVEVPLNDVALNLIKKYANVDKKSRLFPYISAQKYNDAIKNILKECGIDRMVNVRNSKTGENEMKPIYEVAASHMARRTFIGNAYKVVKDPNVIGRISGHVEGSQAFNRYRDIDNNIKKDVVNAIM